MANIRYAALEEQGVNFVVVAVKDNVVDNEPHATNISAGFTSFFNCPVVLLAESTARLFGRDDLVSFLSMLPVDQLPWATTQI